MKKTLYLAAIFAFCLQAQSQNARIGFTAGASFANFHSKANGSSDNGNSKIGLLAGMLVDVPLSSQFSFQPGLQLVQKGTKDEQTSGGSTEKVKLNINYVELPLNFLYNAKSNAGNFFIGAGPSVAFGISGKWKYDAPGTSLTQNVKFGNSDQDDIKSMDVGANFTTGFCFPDGLFIAADYNMGISNLAPGGSANGTLKSHYFGIRLGCLLKGNNKK
ncbi:MAG: porin family protein [Chitinophagales bacterium]